MSERRAILELGEDHLEYGEYSFGALTEDTVWALSIGATKDTPSLQSKADLEVANEDALFVAEQDDRILMAVADAHFGREPSHVLMRAVAAHSDPIPASPHELRDLLQGISEREPMTSSMGGSSFLATVFDRGSLQGFGASFFDSTFAIVGPSGQRRPLGHRDAGIVYPAEPATLAPMLADWFQFAAEPGELLLTYTDGIDCCHYGQAETSVTPSVMAELFEAGMGAAGYARKLIEQAMLGVGDHPGGQDNIALIATRV